MGMQTAVTAGTKYQQLTEEQVIAIPNYTAQQIAFDVYGSLFTAVAGKIL